MRKKLKEFTVNVRKIPLTLEVAFWNFVISTLTIFKEMRSYSQSTPATIPSLRKNTRDKSSQSVLNLLISKIKTRLVDIRAVITKVCFWAMFGFVIGLIFGILLGS